MTKILWLKFGDQNLVIKTLWPTFFDQHFFTHMLWPTCCDQSFVTKMLWPKCYDQNFVTKMLWRQFCDQKCVTKMLWLLAPRQYFQPFKEQKWYPSLGAPNFGVNSECFAQKLRIWSKTPSLESLRTLSLWWLQNL